MCVIDLSPFNARGRVAIGSLNQSSSIWELDIFMFEEEEKQSREAVKLNSPAVKNSVSYAARKNQGRWSSQVSPFSSGYTEMSPFSTGYREMSPFSKDYVEVSPFSPNYTEASPFASLSMDAVSAPVQMKALNEPAAQSTVAAQSPVAAQQIRDPYSGTPLQVSDELSESIEDSFGIDTDELSLRESPEVSKMGARATAQGDVIRFAPGAFNPNTRDGLSVLGHELNHVREQAVGNVQPNVDGTNIHYDKGNEAACDRAGEAFASGTLAGVGPVALAGAEGIGVECRGDDSSESDKETTMRQQGETSSPLNSAAQLLSDLDLTGIRMNNISSQGSRDIELSKQQEIVTMTIINEELNKKIEIENTDKDENNGQKKIPNYFIENQGRLNSLELEIMELYRLGMLPTNDTMIQLHKQFGGNEKDRWGSTSISLQLLKEANLINWNNSNSSFDLSILPLTLGMNVEGVPLTGYTGLGANHNLIGMRALWDTTKENNSISAEAGFNIGRGSYSHANYPGFSEINDELNFDANSSLLNMWGNFGINGTLGEGSSVCISDRQYSRPNTAPSLSSLSLYTNPLRYGLSGSVDANINLFKTMVTL